MSAAGVLEYAAAVRLRYGAAGRPEKKRILDEFCETTGMHRKSAIRLLNRSASPAPRRPGRPRRYGPEVAAALVKVWEVGDRMCGKLLAAVMEQLVESLERHRELVLEPAVKTALLEISAASIDRVLSRHRRRLGVQPRRMSPGNSGLKSAIPVRTWNEWKEPSPGSLQADLVLHCGESTAGFYLATLCAIDVASGWTELQAIWGLGKQRVGSAFHHIRERLPFRLESLHTDNGAEFINHTLYNWCRQEKIAFTRGRAYRKNDQAYVEQRNWQTVRRQVGYDRFSSKEAHALLGQLYPLLTLQLNFFRPIRKVVAKERVGSRTVKRFDTPRTPSQRLLAGTALNELQRHELQARLQATNPADLQRRIEELLRQLWRLAPKEERIVEAVG